MEDLLQQIDLDYYRSARLIIARAQIAQLRQELTASARVEQKSRIPLRTSRAIEDFDPLLVHL